MMAQHHYCWTLSFAGVAASDRWGVGAMFDVRRSLSNPLLSAQDWMGNATAGEDPAHMGRWSGAGPMSRGYLVSGCSWRAASMSRRASAESIPWM